MFSIATVSRVIIECLLGLFSRTVLQWGFNLSPYCPVYTSVEL